MSAALESAREDGAFLLWNPAQVKQVRSEQFEPHWWHRNKRLVGSAPGRGSSLFVNVDDRQWVLRHFKRGGLLAKLITHHYLWLGLEASRPVRELRLLQLLWNAGLPVPEPVAARVCRNGLVYTGDLLTVRIGQARPLADHLARSRLPASAWRDLGGLLARFHREGVYHHDLNARNILVDTENQFWLIDFDRGGIHKPAGWCASNLKRLQRSLRKFDAAQTQFNFGARDWQALEGGYLSYRD